MIAKVDYPGLQMPLQGELVFDVMPSPISSIYDKEERVGVTPWSNNVNDNKNISDEERKKLNLELKNVERQQSEFGEGRFN